MHLFNCLLKIIRLSVPFEPMYRKQKRDGLYGTKEIQQKRTKNNSASYNRFPNNIKAKAKGKYILEIQFYMRTVGINIIAKGLC